MKGYRLQFVGYSLIFFFLLSTATCTLYPTFAAESSPSAGIKSKLEELQKEIASKAALLKGEISGKLKNKAYAGVVKIKSDSSITLATKDGPKIVNINEDSEFESKVRGKKYSEKLISEEDYLASLGDVDETGVLTARRVILLPQPKAGQPVAEKTYLWGKIMAISDKLVTLKDKDFKTVAVSITGPSKVKVSNFIILTGVYQKNDIFKAEFVHIIP